jgi:hypothetical protein
MLAGEGRISRRRHTTKFNPINQLIAHSAIDGLSSILDGVWYDFPVGEGGAECSGSVVGERRAEDEGGSGKE